MKHRAVFALVLLATPVHAGDEPEVTGPAFVMPSGNVACLVQEVELATAATPQPQLFCIRRKPKTIGVTLDETRLSSFTNVQAAQFDWNAPVLNYGDNWWHSDFSCDSAQSGVVCSHPKFGAFQLSRKGMVDLR
jgi:hypothetical protein